MKAIILISLGLIIISCKKETVLPETLPLEKYITIDSIDETFIYHEYENPVRLQYNGLVDSVKNNIHGIDSLDIDLDGVIDFQLKSVIKFDQTNSHFHIIYYSLYPVSDFEIVNYKASTIVHIGGPLNVNYANKYKSGDKLFYERDNWESLNITLWLKSVTAPLPMGHWNNATGIHYIGIRKLVNGDYKYGWLTMNIVSLDEIYFINYALQK